jgi:two-component system cell cycle sensor histidine kinase/response regulator CckA
MMDDQGRARLLLVEDEDRLRVLVSQFLRDVGFDVVEASDGPGGVERFGDSGPFDLVLLDMNLPGCSGVEVCRRIKRLDPGQPVMICSAAVMPIHENALSAMGVHHFLSKPYHPQELIDHISQEVDQNGRSRRLGRVCSA